MSVSPKCHTQRLKLGSPDAPTNTNQLGYRAMTDVPRSKPRTAGMGRNKAKNNHLSHLLW